MFNAALSGAIVDYQTPIRFKLQKKLNDGNFAINEENNFSSPNYKILTDSLCEDLCRATCPDSRSTPLKIKYDEFHAKYINERCLSPIHEATKPTSCVKLNCSNFGLNLSKVDVLKEVLKLIDVQCNQVTSLELNLCDMEQKNATLMDNIKDLNVLLNEKVFFSLV